MSATSSNGKIAEQILDEYMKGFQERNPSLHVFSAHLHMDEATPHLHIDFIPVSKDNKRGLETKNSLKGALKSLGFEGGSRKSSELSQWQDAEKEIVAKLMLDFGIEWERKGTHNKHISVQEYAKKAQYEQNIAKIDKVKKTSLSIKKVEQIKDTPIPFTENTIINSKDLEKLKNGCIDGIISKENHEKSEEIIEELHNALKTANKEIKKLNEQIKVINSPLKKMEQAEIIQEKENLKVKCSVLEKILDKIIEMAKNFGFMKFIEPILYEFNYKGVRKNWQER